MPTHQRRARHPAGIPVRILVILARHYHEAPMQKVERAGGGRSEQRQMGRSDLSGGTSTW